MMSKIPIVFFGSGPVAAKSLELLVEIFDVVAVVTKPRPAHHKGDFPVLSLANKIHLTIFTVKNRQELSALIATKPFNTEVAILIDFGIIVGQDVIDYFPKGIINSHFSLLPEWRGADPITFSLLSGQEQTGVSLMLLVEAMDEGPLLAQSTYKIGESETTISLTETLIEISDKSLKTIVPLWLNNEIGPAAQQEVTMAASLTPSYSRKLTKQDGILDFNKPAVELERQIRAFIEWPKSTTKLAGIDVIITSVSVADFSGTPGKAAAIGKQLIIYCRDSALIINRLKPAGKPEMTAAAFLAGYGKKL